MRGKHGSRETRTAGGAREEGRREQGSNGGNEGTREREKDGGSCEAERAELGRGVVV